MTNEQDKLYTVWQMMKRINAEETTYNFSNYDCADLCAAMLGNLARCVYEEHGTNGLDSVMSHFVGRLTNLIEPKVPMGLCIKITKS
jgi:hypothetical protein